METVAEVYREVRDGGLEEGELERTKNLIKGALVRSTESTERRLYRLGKEFLLNGKHQSLSDRLEKISAVAEEDVMRVASDLIKGSTLNITVLGRESKDIREFSGSSLDL